MNKHFRFYWKELLKQLKMRQKNKKKIFFGILLSTLGTSLLGNMLIGKGLLRAGSESKEGKVMLRAYYGNEMDF